MGASPAEWLKSPLVTAVDGLSLTPGSRIFALSVHFYDSRKSQCLCGFPALPGTRTFEYVNQLNLIDSKGLTDKPVYMTEWNRFSPVGNAAAEAVSAQFCRDAFTDVRNWNAGVGHHNIICMTWFVWDGGDGGGQWDGYSLEYWKTHGNAPGMSGDLYTAFEQSVDLRYTAGAVGTPQPAPPPTAAFTASPTSGSAPLTVTFTDQSTGTVTTRLWNFGDGQTSSAINTGHTYTDPGVFTVSLTAGNSSGSTTQTKIDHITIPAPGGCLPPQITGFEPFAVGSAAMFRQPRLSGTTQQHLAIAPNVAAVSQDVNGYDGVRTCKVQWAFVDTTPQRWLRLTTNNTANLPNPAIDLHRSVRVRLRLDSGSLRVCLGVRETGVDVPVSADGGTAGNIEWIGATSVASGAPQGALVNGQLGVWQTLTFYPAAGNVQTLTGDGVLYTGNGKGVFEHLAFAVTNSAGPFTVYLDKIDQACPPRADFDGDGDVDVSDFGMLQLCLGYPALANPPPGCNLKDLNTDGTVTLLDAGAFIDCLSAPNTAANPDCP
jgi:PKD repeat protein